MQKNIYSSSTVLFNSRFSGEYIEPPCTGELDSKYLFCRQNYSLVSLRQQVNQFIKQSYEKRLNLNQKYNISNANQISVPKEELRTISEYFFYAQSMQDKMANMSHGYKNTILS
jgi:hypothetical protein